MITTDNVHCHTEFTQTFKKHLARGMLHLEVDVLTIVVQITGMKNMFDVMFFDVRKKCLFKESTMILDKRVGRITNTEVSIRKNNNLRHLWIPSP